MLVIHCSHSGGSNESTESTDVSTIFLFSFFCFFKTRHMITELPSQNVRNTTG